MNNIFKIIPFLIVIFMGCSEEKPNDILKVCITREKSGERWVLISKNNIETRVFLVDWEICETQLPDVLPCNKGVVDLDGDGNPEILVSAWGGGNRHDELFIFREKLAGCWEKVGSVLTPFEFTLQDKNSDGVLEIVVPENGGKNEQVFCLKRGKLVELDSFSIVAAPENSGRE